MSALQPTLAEAYLERISNASHWRELHNLATEVQTSTMLSDAEKSELDREIGKQFALLNAEHKQTFPNGRWT